MWGIARASRHLSAASGRDRNGGFPWHSVVPMPVDGALVDGAPALRCPASSRRAGLAENHGKPSLWVNVKDFWYQFPQAVSWGGDDAIRDNAIIVDNVEGDAHARILASGWDRAVKKV